MDVAQEFESALILRQKPVDIAVERGDSDIQKFYKDSVVFVTGGSGFLGKQFIEKLIKSCDVKKIYVLLRAKKDKTTHQRLALILNEPAFDNLHKIRPGFREKIEAVEGDITELSLGICNDDWRKITDEIHVIIHMAATTRFNESLRFATITNVRGTREVIRLAKDCRNLRSLVHVSTAFAHATLSRRNKEVSEQFYPSPVPPQTLIDLAEQVDDRLEDIGAMFIKDYANTYVFTKAVADEAVRVMSGDLPVCIVKPPVVMGSYYEPAPGWIDQSALVGPSGVILSIGLGVLHVLMAKNVGVNIAPVDYVNNAVIAAGWDVAIRRNDGDKETVIHTICSSSQDFSIDLVSRRMRQREMLKYSTPKAIYSCFLVETENPVVYWVLFWLLHFIPAYITDGVCFILGIKLKDVPSAVKVYTKIYNLSTLYKYFFTHEWDFKDDNCKALFTRMSPTDKQIYNFDMSTIDWKEILVAWCIGLRKYIVKDGLKGSAYGEKKQFYLGIANYVFMTIYIYALWRIVYFLFTVLTYFF